MLVRLSNSGHYPSKIVEVSEEELKRLQALERTYGYLDAVSARSDLEFIEQVWHRPAAGPTIYTIIKYG